MRQFQDDLDRFRPHQVVNFILVDAKALKMEVLAPVPQKALHLMKTCLRSVAKGRCLDAFRRTEAASRAIQSSPKMHKKRDYDKEPESIPDVYVKDCRDLGRFRLQRYTYLH